MNKDKLIGEQSELDKAKIELADYVIYWELVRNGNSNTVESVYIEAQELINKIKELEKQ